MNKHEWKIMSLEIFMNEKGEAIVEMDLPNIKELKDALYSDSNYYEFRTDFLDFFLPAKLRLEEAYNDITNLLEE